MSKYTTPKALKSKDTLKKGLVAYSKKYGIKGGFFAAFTFDDKTGTYKICPCCGGDSLQKDILSLI